LLKRGLRPLRSLLKAGSPNKCVRRSSFLVEMGMIKGSKRNLALEEEEEEEMVMTPPALVFPLSSLSS
jgi:hypothetical protein